MTPRELAKEKSTRVEDDKKKIYVQVPEDASAFRMGFVDWWTDCGVRLRL